MAACANCGHDNLGDARFCTRCGRGLTHACPSCGSPSRPGDVFCAQCGAALGEPSALPEAAAAPVAERRLVSVLFADLVGFTSLSESRDAEEVRELLSRYFDTCRRLIGLYGGTVEKFIGDAVMAVWGTPAATEDDAERAVRAALDLVAAVSALGDEVGTRDLRARAGVLTGEAAVTLGATGEGMVAGDLVNTASRIQAVAQPGAVLVGDATRRASEQAIAYRDAGEHALKGKAEPVTLYRALRVVSGRGGELRSEGLEAPFVGRDRELSQIKDLFHACAHERKSHLLSVAGIAGIGKSRLAWEFKKYVDGIVEGVWWHRGRCLAYGEGVTYWALADMIRMRCRIAENEEPPAAAAKLHATLVEQLLDDGERRFVEPRLAQLLGLAEPETTDRQELYAAWRLFFERLADSSPVVMVFEDLQWADASLLDFVEYLLEWSRNHPIFVVTLARPELLERRPTWGAGQRNFTALFLEPLSEEAMEQLLEGLVPGLPIALRDQIMARAEGVPLYAVETVRMLLDRGLLAQEGPVYRVVGEIAALDVPETLQALIAARLDGLSAEERRLLQDGAVLGKTFTPSTLAALSGQPEEELSATLASLVRKEVLSIQADPRSPEHGQYGFLQELVRRVAYETLSRRERRRRHLAAAEQLAVVLGEEEAAEIVASHLLAAYRAADSAEAAELQVRAGAAYVRAGERAASLAAAVEAERYFRQAAELTGDPLDRAELLGRAGGMAWRANRPAEARALLDQAHDVLAGHDDPRAAGPAAVLAEIDFDEGHPQQAVARLETALQALDAGGPVTELAAVAAQLGRFLIFCGEHEHAGRHLERALTLAEAHGLTETLVQALNSKAVIAMASDRLHESRILLEGALELALAQDLHSAALRIYNNLGVVLEQSDVRTTERLATYERALELARRAGERRWESSLLSSLPEPLLDAGRWDEVLTIAAQVEETGETEFARAGALDAVPIHCNRGELGQARELLTRHAAMARSGNPELAVGYTLLEAIVARAEERPQEALAITQRALAASRGMAATSWLRKYAISFALEWAADCSDLGTVRRLLADLDELPPGKRGPYLEAQRARFRARLEPDDADRCYALAERLTAELEKPFDLAVIQLEHAECLAGQDRADDARQLLGEARETFERLRAAPWVDRVDRVETGTRAEIPAY